MSDFQPTASDAWKFADRASAYGMCALTLLEGLIATLHQRRILSEYEVLEIYQDTARQVETWRPDDPSLAETIRKSAYSALHRDVAND